MGTGPDDTYFKEYPYCGPNALYEWEEKGFNGLDGRERSELFKYSAEQLENEKSGSESSSSHDTAGTSSDDCTSITDTVCAMEGVTVFCELLKNPKRRHLGYNAITKSTSTDEFPDAVAMSSPTGASASSDGADFASAFGFEDESEEFSLFVPTDAAFAEIADAFETLSDAEAGRVIMFHMYSGMLLTSDKLACSEI